MTDDERAIRDLITNWQSATRAGDTARVLGFMAEDVVFLLPGRPPIRGRDAFAALAKGQEGMHVESVAEIVEVEVHGDWAHSWCRLSVSMTPPDGGPPVHRSGDVLSILRKKPNGAWVLFRDANMLAPTPSR